MTRRSFATETKSSATVLKSGIFKSRPDTHLATANHSLAKMTTPLVQAKLRIGAPDDKYEQEADRVADQVMRMPESGLPGEPTQNPPVANTAISRLQRQETEEEEEEVQPGSSDQKREEATPILDSVPTGDADELGKEDEEEEEPVQASLLSTSQPSVQRQVGEEEEEEEEPVQASLLSTSQPSVQRQAGEEEEEEETLQGKTSSSHAAVAEPGLSSQIQSLRGGGSELSSQTRNFFEARFGRDFSAVRIHSGARATEAAATINARAFTVGRDVVFGARQYQPHSEHGKHLLAHELTHVVQQNPERVQRKPQSVIAALVSERIQARRLPPGTSISGTVSSGSPGAGAHRRGLARLVARAMAELNPAQRTTVRTRARGALSAAQFSALRPWQRNQRLADAIRRLHHLLPDLRHGHPNQFMIGPRNPVETANLGTLVTLANAYFMVIAANALDASIDQVFGAANRPTEKPVMSVPERG